MLASVPPSYIIHISLNPPQTIHSPILPPFSSQYKVTKYPIVVRWSTRRSFPQSKTSSFSGEILLPHNFPRKLCVSFFSSEPCISIIWIIPPPTPRNERLGFFLLLPSEPRGYARKRRGKNRIGDMRRHGRGGNNNSSHVLCMRRAKNLRINSNSASKSIQITREEEGNTSQIRIQKSKSWQTQTNISHHSTPTTQHSQESSQEPTSSMDEQLP